MKFDLHAMMDMSKEEKLIHRKKADAVIKAFKEGKNIENEPLENIIQKIRRQYLNNLPTLQ